jgi:hypothetical protein
MMNLPASCEQGVHRAHKARSSICKGTVYRFLWRHILQQNGTGLLAFRRTCTVLQCGGTWTGGVQLVAHPVLYRAQLICFEDAAGLFNSVALRRLTKLCNESESSNLYGFILFYEAASFSFLFTIKRKLVRAMKNILF